MREIKMFSDFACPFCYIGFSILERLQREKNDLNFKFIPLILNPEESLEGSNLFEHVPKKIALEGYERIVSLGNEYGLIYNNKENRFNTNRLHKAALYAYDKGKYFEFAKLGYQYIFEFGKNVGYKEIINEIAQKTELNISDMNEKIDLGIFDKQILDGETLSIKYNVDSVPTFIVDDIKKSTILKDYKNFIHELLD